MENRIGCFGWTVVFVIGFIILERIGLFLLIVAVGMTLYWIIYQAYLFYHARHNRGRHSFGQDPNYYKKYQPKQDTTRALITDKTQKVENEEKTQFYPSNYSQVDENKVGPTVNYSAPIEVNRKPTKVYSEPTKPVDTEDYIQWMYNGHTPSHPTITDEQNRLRFDMKYGSYGWERYEVRPYLIPTRVIKLRPENSTELEYVDSLNGWEFEQYVGRLLESNGFGTVDVTKASGDQGIDVIAFKNDKKFVFQCKHFKNAVGNKAIQEIFAGKAFEDADKAVVITNSSFTHSAAELASKLDIELWDRNKLSRLINHEK